MLVTEIEKVSKNKRNIFIDNKFAFVLYKGELKYYEIEIGKELNNNRYKEIINRTLYKRAQNRALYLLTAREYTEKELSARLCQNRYPEEVIEKVVIFLKEYHYLDDLSYTRQFIRAYGKRKSAKQITEQLYHKGIAKDTVRKVMGQEEVNDTEAILKLAKKKVKRAEELDMQKESRLIRYLFRKGFHYEDICQCICRLKNNDIDENDEFD